MTRYAAEVTGGMFVVAALLLWLGWALSSGIWSP
jgi:hypothetical protein